MIWIFHIALLQTKESIVWHPLDLQILSGISSPRSSWYWSYRTVTWLSKTQLLNLSSGGSCCIEVWSWHGPTQCNKCSKPLINIRYPRNSLEVQWLELKVFTAMRSDSIAGEEIKLPQAMRCKQTKRERDCVSEAVSTKLLMKIQLLEEKENYYSLLSS